MTFIILALTLLFLVVLPLALVTACATAAFSANRPEDEPVSSYPTTLQVAKAGVLNALARNDLVAARTAFIDMVGACGSCYKL